MECKKCTFPLRIAKSEFKSELNSTDVFNVQQLACVNPVCPDYSKDLDNPIIVETVRNKIS